MKNPKYASIFKRFFAFTIDCFVIVGIYMALGLFLGMSAIFAAVTSLPMIGFWFYGGLFFVSWLYFAGFECSSWQATIGKHLLGLKVANLKGKPIGFWRATARYFSKILSRLLFCIGFLMILFTKKKQALHDKIARTVILSK